MRLFSAIFLLLITIISVNAQNIDDAPLRPFAYTTYVNGDYDLHIMDLNSREVIHSITSPEWNCPLEMSSNQRYLLISNGRGTRKEYFVLNIETNGLIEMPDIQDFSWSSDGTRLAYTTDSEDGELSLYIHDFISGMSEEISVTGEIAVFSWHSNELYFVTITNNIIVDVFAHDGVQVSLIHTEIFSYLLPVDAFISPDAGHIIVRVHNDKLLPFYYINITSGEMSVLTIEVTNLTRIATWHPDSTHITFRVLYTGYVLYDLIADTYETLNSSSEYTSMPAQREFDSATKIQWSADGRLLAVLNIVSLRDSIQPYDLFVSNFPIESIPQGLGFPIAGLRAFEAGEFEWVSDTEIVYVSMPPTISSSDDYDNFNDLYLYNRFEPAYRLTNTPGIHEQIGCVDRG